MISVAKRMKARVGEVLLNAVAHRDYAIAGPSKVAIFDDRIEVFSPGPFPGPIDVNHLEAGVSYIRNPVICRALREAGYIEKLGTGFITLLDAYRDAGLLQPTVISAGDYVKCILPRVRSEEAPTTWEERVVDAARRQGELRVPDVQAILGVSRPTATRRIQDLVRRGLLKREGAGPGTRYRTRERDRRAP